MRIQNRDSVKPSPMAIVSGHNGTGDDLSIKRNQKQVGLHFQLRGDRDLRGIPRRIIRERLTPKRADPVKMSRPISHDFDARHRPKSILGISNWIIMNLASCGGKRNSELPKHAIRILRERPVPLHAALDDPATARLSSALFVLIDSQGGLSCVTQLFRAR